MRLWTRNKDSHQISLRYADQGDLESCTDCLLKDIRGQCNRNRYAVRKELQDRSEVLFCFDKNTPGKHASAQAKIYTSGIESLSRFKREHDKEISKLEAIALHNVKKQTSNLGRKLEAIAPDSLVEKT